jgi:hypothetical protein
MGTSNAEAKVFNDLSATLDTRRTSTMKETSHVIHSLTMPPGFSELVLPPRPSLHYPSLFRGGHQLLSRPPRRPIAIWHPSSGQGRLLQRLVF